jgi:diguanylate cyclase (GGDEF)-like protein/PAS domain S-box-containing protein
MMPHQAIPQDSPPSLQPLLAGALASAANAIFITDAGGHIIWANPAFSRLSGYSLDEALGSTPALMKSGIQNEAFYAQLWHTILSGDVWRGQVVDRKKDGNLYTVDETITPLIDQHGVITHFLAIQQDMTVHRQEEERNRYLAYHDVLTDLPNRAFFLGLQRQALSQAKRARHMLALLFLDLDKFKPVNDQFGHDVGDKLLLQVAQRLSSAVRKSDTVARIGGDEFAIVLPTLPDTGVAEMLASKLIDGITRPFIIDGREIRIGASVGIAFYPIDGEDPDELMRKADQAMYAAKSRGGNGYRLFSACQAKSTA